MVARLESRDGDSVTSRAVTRLLWLFGLAITARGEGGGIIPALFCRTSASANGLFSCFAYYVHALLKGHVLPVQWLYTR